MTVAHRNAPFFFSSTFGSLTAPLTHPKWIQTAGGGWGHKPPGTALGARQLARPWGHDCSPSQRGLRPVEDMAVTQSQSKHWA